MAEPNTKPDTDTPPKEESKRPTLKAAPPPKDTAPKEKSQTKRSPGRPPGLARQITDFYDSVGTAVGFVSMDDGAAILEVSEEAGQAWATLASKNPAVRKAWERILTGNAWTGIIMVHAPLMYRIASNHGLAPELVNPLAREKPEPESHGNPPPPLG